MKKKKKISPANDRFAQQLIKCDGDIKLAYRRSHPEVAEATVKSESYRVAKKPEVKERIEYYMNRAGATKATIAKKIVDLLDCEKGISINKKLCFVPDNAVQLNTAILATKLMGELKEGNTVHIGDNEVNIFNSQQNTMVVAADKIAEIYDRIEKDKETIELFKHNDVE